MVTDMTDSVSVYYLKPDSRPPNAKPKLARHASTSTRHAPPAPHTRTRTRPATTLSISTPLPDDFDAVTQGETTFGHIPRPSRARRSGVSSTWVGYDDLETSASVSVRMHQVPGKYQLEDRSERSERNYGMMNGGNYLGEMKEVPVKARARTSTAAAKRSGKPRAGLEYEVVHNRVVEDSPSRTVTISTWREKVADATATATAYAPEEDFKRQSVYYLGAGEGYGYHYPEVDADPYPQRGTEREKDNTRRGVEEEKQKDNQDRRNTLTESLAFSPNLSRSSETVTSRYPPMRDSMLPPKPRGGLRKRPAIPFPFPVATSTPPPTTKTTPLWDSARDRDLPKLPRRSFLRESDSRSGSQSSFRVPSPSTGIMPGHAQFGHKRDNSLKGILSSCEPSLAHTISILKSLGIQTEQHLRAVAMLGEDTRDREVRDVALRKGMTVFEWAVLMDRILAWAGVFSSPTAFSILCPLSWTFLARVSDCRNPSSNSSISTSLNEDDTDGHTLKFIVPFKKANTSADQYLLSDADEQLLLNVHFNQAVRDRSIQITSKVANQVPKKIKLVVNKPALGFDDVEDAEELAVAQVVELPQDGKPVALRYVRFQDVSRLHIFVVSNYGGEDETLIDSIDLIGSPVATTTDLSGLANQRS